MAVAFVVSDSIAMLMRRGSVSRVVMAVILGMLVPISFGMGGAFLLFFSVGFSGLAAGEEHGGEGERCEYLFHLVVDLVGAGNFPP